MNVRKNPSILIGYPIVLILFCCRYDNAKFYWLQIKLARLAKFVNVMLTSFRLLS